MSDSKFYTEIAILRGVSVLCVLFYHLQFPFFGSGYLGVDVFFVISGFLMAALYADIKGISGTLHFYRKRIRRIVPAYFAVLLAVTGLSAALVLPHELYDIARHHLWSVFLAPNMGFWMESSYFESQQFKPFLNFWSLGVELQFYAVFPLLLWLMHKSRWWLPAITLASYGLCFYMAELSPKTAFFMMPARIWEFCIGFYAAGFLLHERALPKPPAYLWLGVAALAGLVVLMALPLTETQHMRYGSLAVAVLSGIVIVAGLPQKFMHGRLGKMLQGLGTYSYSIYLVHFPVIAFFLYEPFGGLALKPLEPTALAMVLGLTAALSAALYHWVETPLRKALPFRKAAAGYAAIVTLLLVLPFAAQALQAQKFDEPQRKIFAAWQDRAVYRCGKLARLTDPFSQSCRISQDHGPSAQGYLLVGDSHADAIKTTLASLADESGSNLRMMKDNCNLGHKPCDVQTLLQETQIQGLQNIIFHAAPGGVRAENLEELLKIAPPYLRVIYIEPVPVWDRHVPQALFEQTEQTQTINEYNKRNAALAAPIAALSYDHLERIAVAPALCAPACKTVDSDGHPLYFDNNHVTLTGAEYLRGALASVFQPQQ